MPSAGHCMNGTVLDGGGRTSMLGRGGKCIPGPRVPTLLWSGVVVRCSASMRTDSVLTLPQTSTSSMHVCESARCVVLLWSDAVKARTRSDDSHFMCIAAKPIFAVCSLHASLPITGRYALRVIHACSSTHGGITRSAFTTLPAQSSPVAVVSWRLSVAIASHAYSPLASCW